MAENLHSVIKELECPICFETMHDPRSLQCEHTYCKECVEECISFEGEFFVECPECRAKHTFHGEDTVSCLKAPLVLKKMLDRVQDSNSHKSQKDKEENLSPRCCLQAVEWYCWECKIYCCRTCINAHFFKSCGEFHHVKYSKKYESFTLYCNKHKSFHIKGCLSCACTACPYCRYDVHEGHTIVSIDEYASKFKTPLISKIQQIKDYNEKQGNFLRGLKLLSDFTEQEERAKKLVSERKMIALAHVLFMLEKVESQVMCNFTKYKLAAEKSVQNLEERLNSKVESVKELLESFESLAGKDNLEVISQTKDILVKFYSILPPEVREKEEKVPECIFLMKGEVAHNVFDEVTTDNMFTAISGAFANALVHTVDENNIASQSPLVTERVANFELNPEFAMLILLEESHKYITQYLKKIGFNIADGVNAGNEQSQDKAKSKKDKKVKSLEKKIANLEREKEEQKKMIDMLTSRLKELNFDVDNSTTLAKPTSLIRKYCDKCEAFDLHETEDCPEHIDDVGGAQQEENIDASITPLLSDEQRNKSLKNLAAEVMILLGEHSPMEIPYSDLPKQYSQKFKRMLNAKEHGFKKLIQLVQALPGIQITEKDGRKIVSLADNRLDKKSIMASEIKSILAEMKDHVSSVLAMPNLYKEKKSADFPYTKDMMEEFLQQPGHHIYVIGQGLSRVIFLQHPGGFPMLLLAEHVGHILYSSNNFEATLEVLNKKLCKRMGVDFQVGLEELRKLISLIPQNFQVNGNTFRLISPGVIIPLLRNDVAQLFDDKLNRKIPFCGLGDEISKKFKRRFSVSMYWASSLISLLNSLGEGFFKIYGDGDDRKITLGPAGKFYCRCIRLMKQCDGAIILDQFQPTYEEVFKVELQVEKFDCADVESLIKRFPEQLRVYGETDKVVVWVEKWRNARTDSRNEEDRGDGSSSSQAYSAKCTSLVKACRNDASEVIELVTEPNNTLLLSTLQSQFSGAVGLKYKSPNGGCRGVRQHDDVLSPPNEGWGAYKFYVNYGGQKTQKSDDDSDASDASELSNQSSIDAGEKKGKRSKRRQKGRGKDGRSSGATRAQSGDLRDGDSDADNAGRGRNNSRGRPPRRGGRGRGRGEKDGRNQSTFRDQQHGLQHDQQGERAPILPTPLFQAHQRPSSASSFPNLSSTEFTCYKCGKNGHTVMNCPLNF